MDSKKYLYLGLLFLQSLVVGISYAAKDSETDRYEKYCKKYPIHEG